MTKSKPAHSRYSPSSAYRYMRCPGSQQLVDRLPPAEEERPSKYALEGKKAHAYAASYLKKEIDWSQPHNQEFELNARLYEDFVKEQLNCVDLKPHHLAFLEREITIFNEPLVYGTVDLAIHDQAASTLHVFDYKYGSGLGVGATDNPQLLLYAYGIWKHPELKDSEIEKFKLHIVQPRMHNFSSWELDLDEFASAVYSIKAHIRIAEQINSPLVPGTDQCRWCPVKFTCPALADIVSEVLHACDNPYAFKDLQVKHWLNKSLIAQYLKDLESEFKHDLEQGKEIEGLKLVAGRASRQWTESGAQKLISNFDEADIFISKLISPFQAEKTLGKKAVEGLWRMSEGKPVLAAASDKRSRINPDSFNHQFKNEDN